MIVSRSPLNESAVSVMAMVSRRLSSATVASKPSSVFRYQAAANFLEMCCALAMSPKPAPVVPKPGSISTPSDWASLSSLSRALLPASRPPRRTCKIAAASPRSTAAAAPSLFPGYCAALCRTIALTRPRALASWLSIAFRLFPCARFHLVGIESGFSFGIC